MCCEADRAGQRLRVDGRRGSLGARSLRPRLAAPMMVCQQSDQDRTNEGRMNECTDGRSGPSANLVQVQARLIEFVVALDLPTNPVQIGYLKRSNVPRQVSQKEAVSLGSRHRHQAACHFSAAATDAHSCVQRIAIELQNLLFDQQIEIAALGKGAGDLATADAVDRKR